MKRLFRHSPYLIGILLLMALILLLTFSVWAAPEADPGINKVYVTRTTDGSFYVSWTTNSPSDGHVDYGTATPTITESDTVTSTITHFVRISGLTDNTPYMFLVRSGTETDDNGGAYYTITTGPTIDLPGPGPQIWGVMYEANGTTPVADAIVYLQLQDEDGFDSPGDSHWTTARTDDTGTWYYDTNDFRTQDLSEYFTFTHGVDKIRIVWQGGDKGVIGENPDDIHTYLIPSTDTQIDMNLDGVPNAIDLTTFNVVGMGESPLLPFLGAAALIILAAILIWRFVSRRAQA
ncbi:MAG: hypothetical protein U9R58_03165 [Chloroflexota bacterium]|nr:hypothetical protein [Chloroflexota bacterium]